MNRDRNGLQQLATIVTAAVVTFTALTGLSAETTVTFSSTEASAWNDAIAEDGDGSSANIAGRVIQFFNISDTSGTLIPQVLVHGNSFASDGFNALTTYATVFNSTGWKGMEIRSQDGSEFQVNGFYYSNFGEGSAITITVKGYRNGSEVASTQFSTVLDAGYQSQVVTLDATFDAVDEVRLYSSGTSWHGINSIKIDAAVTPNSAPTDLALSSSSISQATGVNGVVGTLSSTDADVGDTFTYTLVAGTGATDNALFNLSGATLRANNTTAMAAGNYSVRLRTTDAAGAIYEEAFTIVVVDSVPPTVVSITRKSPTIQAVLTNPAVFTVTFSEAVTGVTTNWFMVAPINGSTVDGLVTDVTGGPTVYDVTVNVTSGSGEFRLNLLKYPMSTFASVNGPSALTFDAAGYLYASTYDSSIGRVDTNGVASTLASGFYGTELGLATDMAGNVYAAETGNHTVVRVTPGGTKTTFATNLFFVCGLAFDATGDLYTSGLTNRFINRVNTNGSTIVFSNSVIYPRGLAFDAAGNLYVANSKPYVANQILGRVSRITTNGVASDFASGFNNPQGLAFDQAGNLYVSDNGMNNSGMGANTISRVDTNGVVTLILTDFVGGDTLSSAISFDAAGNLYVASPLHDRVSKMTFSSLYDLGGNALIGLPYTNGASYVYGTDAVPTGMALTNNSISQAATNNAVVGTFRTTNSYPSDTFTYALVSGVGDTDNSRFSISGNSLLVNNAGAMAVGTYSVRVRSTESLGLTLETVFAINITDGVSPTLVSITRGSPTAPAISTTNVTFAVTFTEPVSSLKLRSFVVTPTSGSITGNVTAISGGPTVYGVTVALSGAAGTVRLDMPALTNSVITTFASGLGNPRGLAFDAANNLYAASVTGNSVLKVTPSGVASTFATGFSGPQGIAFDAAGNLYVANTSSGTISVVTPAGNVSTFASGFTSPQGLAFDSAGNLYVANSGDGTIIKVAANATTTTFASGFTTPTALVFDAAGNLFVSDASNGTVSRVTPAGNVSLFATGLGQPYSLALDALGNLYVGNASVVNVISTSGVVRLFASGLNQARGLAFDSAGDLYGTRASGNTARKFIINNAQDLAGNLLAGGPYTSGDSYTYTPPVAPTIALSTNTAFYTLGAAPVLLDPLAGCAAGSAAFNGGVLNVTLVSNAEPRDVLGVFDQGTAAGEISVSPSQITFGGSTIASFSGISTGATSMTFTFNANANASGVQQLLRNLTYRTITNRPATFTRTLQLTVSAGGLTSAPVVMTLELNHRPTAGGDRIVTGTNLPVFISYARMLANDSDYDGDGFAMLPINTNTASGGTLVVETNGVTFTPLGSFAAAGSFTYQIQDMRGGLNTGGVHVQVLSAGQLFVEDLPRDATASSNSLTLAVMDIPNRTYRIQASDDLSLWTQIGTVLTPASGLVRYWDADAINHTNRFYRTVYP